MFEGKWLAQMEGDPGERWLCPPRRWAEEC
jgi:hypothetical protein